MRRPTSLLILTLLVAAPAMAQTTPTPQPPRGMLTPPAMAPTPMPPQATTPPATAPTPGQTPAPRPAPPRAPSIGAPSGTQVPAATNIRLDLVITDTFTGTPVKKSVSLLLLTGNSGMIRTSNTGTGNLAVLNVDAIAAGYLNGQIPTRITFEYSPAPQTEGPLAGRRSPTLNESITVVLQDGKPLMISQSADPATDRKVTAELTATILK
jgi:hypothetical protein